MGGIFISYRRHDSAGWAGHLSEHLEQCFGPDQIFMDIDKIEAGTDFVEAIEKAVSSCSILLAVIGPAWLTSVDTEGRRRLDNSEDFIRLEIATALSREIRVIPVLVGGAVMPTSQELPDDLKALTRRQAHELTDSRWDFDTEQLIKSIEKAGLKRRPEIKSESTAAVDPPKMVSKKAIASTVISFLLFTMFFQESPLTFDMKIGGMIIALAALILGLFAFFDIRVNKARGKILALIGIGFSGLIILVFINQLSSHETMQKPVASEPTPPPRQHSAPSEPSSPLPPPSKPADSKPVDTKPAPHRPATPPPVVTNITGIWAGSDGLTYSIQQQGNVLAVVGGYPNQAVLITATGSINGQNIYLDYLRATDRTGGKARFSLSANRRTLQGQHRNIVTGEEGQLILSR